MDRAILEGLESVRYFYKWVIMPSILVMILVLLLIGFGVLQQKSLSVQSNVEYKRIGLTLVRGE